MDAETPVAIVYVFVSSTYLDLQLERKAVEAALQRLRETKFVGMEYFGSRDEDTRRASLDEVNRSQVYVGIFGGRYGSGITEAEYRRARERGLTCRIYFKDEAAITSEGREMDSEKAAKLAALKEELRRSHTITIFTTPDDLAAKVTADLHSWLFNEYLAPRLERAVRGEVPPAEAQALLTAARGSPSPAGSNPRLERFEPGLACVFAGSGLRLHPVSLRQNPERRRPFGTWSPR